MRNYFILFSMTVFLIIGALSFIWPQVLFSLLIFGPIISIGTYDCLQKTHSILKNYPVIGHFRFLSEFIGPELHQYFVESDIDGRPFSRLQREFVYKRAKKDSETHPFGTELNVYEDNYQWIAHSIYPKAFEIERVKIGSLKSYEACIFNISGMSFGALSGNAVMSLNRAAKAGNFYQNTGEGGISKYHEKYGGDIVFQIGTGYFGCRDENGKFSETEFIKNASKDQVKMIEIKLSQGAKPGMGGHLPAAKNTPEIAEPRGFKPYTSIKSPAAHSAFNDSASLLLFIHHLRILSLGKPIGIKLCIGSKDEFFDLLSQAKSSNIFPDFITIDGAEGGTGAAPPEFSDHVGMPLEDALIFVNQTLKFLKIKDRIKIIASGKVITGFDIVKCLSLGADICNSARGMLFAIGCIQALKCNTNNCPTGITTHDPSLTKGLVVEEKYQRVVNYHEATLKSVKEILGATGVSSINQISSEKLFKRCGEVVKSYSELEKIENHE